MFNPNRIDWSDPSVAAQLLIHGVPAAIGGRARIGPNEARGPSRSRAGPATRRPQPPAVAPFIQPALDETARIARSAIADRLQLRPFRLGGPHIGELAEQSEAGGRNPGMINPGQGDAGGPSYGLPQLATNYRHPEAFLRAEGRRWQRRFGEHRPGTPAFDRVWTAVAAEEPIAFGDAQRDYAGRSLYRRAVGDTFGATGMNLDDRAHAIRAATWSTSLQHGGAAKLLTRAIQATDKRLERASPGYDSLLLNHIYGQRIGLVKELSEDRENYTDSERRNFRNIIRNRFHEEPRRATRLLELER